MFYKIFKLYHFSYSMKILMISYLKQYSYIFYIYLFTLIYLKGRVTERWGEKGDKSSFILWFLLEMLVISPQFHLGILHRWQGHKNLAHLLLLSLVHWQRTYWRTFSWNLSWYSSKGRQWWLTHCATTSALLS